MATDNWNNLVPKDLLIDIVQRSSCPNDYYRFSAVCKSWNSAAYEAAASLEGSVIDQKPWWLLLRRFPSPMLLLAEEVALGSIISDTKFDLNSVCDSLKDSVGNSRRLYSLSSNKTYSIELPEAAGKVILSASKGWLLTLGRDFQMNLLHPLFGYKISLPPLLPEYNDRHTPSAYLISKVAMSSSILEEKKDATWSSIVMAIYGKSDSLGFARPRDKVWTDVNVNSDHSNRRFDDIVHHRGNFNSDHSNRRFDDIVYHRGNFYAVDSQGDVYVCCIDSDEHNGGLRGKKIASMGSINWEAHEQYYLVEPLSGSGLWLIVRYLKRRDLTKRRGWYFTERHRLGKYRTIDFAVWRLDLDYNDSPYIRLTKEKNLGGEAIFVGRASSISVPSSDIIKPNSIYFTDDFNAYTRGHDIRIFNMERRRIEPQGKTIRGISPPLWKTLSWENMTRSSAPVQENESPPSFSSLSKKFG